jgi:phosphopantetheinyl transferase
MSRLYLGAIGCARGALPPGPRPAGTLALSADELDRAGSLRSAAAKRRFLAGRWLARTMLSGLMDLPAAAIPICLSANGRPTLARGEPWDFNISHSGDLVACAVADRPVGVDLERVTARRDLLGIARECFHPGEVEDLAAQLSAAGQQAAAVRFAAYWTLKEAHLKRQGGGVWDIRDAPRFPLEAGHGTGHGTEAGETAAAWCCLEIPSRASLPSAYVLAVSTGQGAGPGLLSGPELGLRFLLAEDPRPRLLFDSASAGQPTGRAGKKERPPG